MKLVAALFLRRSFRWATVVAGVTVHLLALAASVAGPTPEVSISLSGADAGQIERGEPWRVFVRLDAPDDATEPIELNPATGTIAGCIVVELVRAKDQSLVVTARPADAAGLPRATLDQERIVTGIWYLDAASMAGVAPGDYVVRARLAIRGGAGWTGDAKSSPLELKIIMPEESAQRVSTRAIARTHDRLLAGKPAEAASHLDAVLAQNPNDIEVLAMRAALSMRGGNQRMALITIRRARELVARAKLGHPPVELFELEQRIFAATAVAEPPGWTIPPASVLRAVVSLEEERRGALSPSATASVASSSPPPTAAPPPTVPASISTATTPSVGASAALNGVLVPAAELSEAKIFADSAGQWAASAAAGSQYGKTQYSAKQATGAPNISVAGNSPDAWCPANKTKGTDWLEVTFSKPVYATEVRVRQNDTAGAITKIEAIEPGGTVHLWWEGVDPYSPPAVREIVWIGVRVPKTDYLVARVKITLDLAAMPGWKQIDTVQLVGNP